MATKFCEKCICYDKCKADMDVAPDDTFSFFPYNEDCPHFKNTADVVEVVRCARCAYAHFNKDVGAYSCKRRDYYSEFVKPTDFCSYGVGAKTEVDI